MGARFLISSQTLSSSAATVTFSSIPATYTDLVLRMSVRTTLTGDTAAQGQLTTNTIASAGSVTRLVMDGSTASSNRGSGSPYIFTPGLTTADSTANTFGSLEIYIPSYTATQNKPMSIFGTAENNTATFSIANAWGVFAGLISATGAIDTITFKQSASYNLVTGSSFYLYGISKTN